MKIIDVCQRPVNACCQFEYQGFTVSVSTIFTPGSVAVFKPDGTCATDRDFYSVADALEFCNRPEAHAMNKIRRAKLNKLQDRLTALKLPEAISAILDIASELETFRDEEQEAYDNLPESMQNGDKGQAMLDAIDAMENALDPLQTFADGFPCDEIFANLEDAKGAA